MVIQVQKFILILIRIASFIVICPAFSFKGLPNIFKVALASSLSFLVYVTIPEIEVVNQMFALFILAVKESLFGLALGYVTKLVFSAMEIAGQLIDFQAGFSMASVYDPNMGINASNYGRLYYWCSICTFFLLDMHHQVINTLVNSFNYVPITTVSIGNISAKIILSIFIRIFELSINLAAPMIIVILMTDVILGVISRTVPQINVLMMGMPLKAMVSFLATMVSLSYLLNSMGKIIQLIPGYLEGIIGIF